MSQTEVGKSERSSTITAEECRQRARALVEPLRSLAAEAEQLRRLPAASMRLIRDSGLIRVIQPASCGGYELSMRAQLDVVSTIAEGCSATAWVVAVCHAHTWMMGHFGHRAQQEVYADDPDAVVAAVIGPRGKAIEQADGSYLLSGTHPFASGSEHAAWLLLGAELIDRAGRSVGQVDCLVPASAVEFKDDWHVAGLQGTGSCTLVTRNLAVPAHRMLRLDRLLERNLPTYDSPDTPALSLAQAGPVLGIAICGPALGTARAAIADFIRATRGKTVMYTPHVSHEWIPTQMAVGHAAALVNAAELILYRVADEVDDFAARGEAMSAEQRGRIRMDQSLAVRFCLDAVERLYMAAGASGLSLASPIQRAARDVRAMNMHGLLFLDPSAEIYGRILLGLGSNSPVY